MTTTFRKHDERDDLLAMASDVIASPASSAPALTARDAARMLIGVAGWVSRKTSVEGMQERMALLCRHEAAWTSGLNDLPLEYNGRVDEHLALIAVVASSMLPIVSPASLRAAMAFWATEQDSAVWQQLAA